jgi:hypothetical protein
VGSPSAADAAPFDFRRCDQWHIADRPGFFVGEALHRLAGVLGIGFGVVAAAAMIAGWVFLKRHETRLADAAERALPGPLETPRWPPAPPPHAPLAGARRLS